MMEFYAGIAWRTFSPDTVRKKRMGLSTPGFRFSLQNLL
jgi:hypothetical protein